MGLSRHQYLSIHGRYFELKCSNPFGENDPFLNYDAYCDKDSRYFGHWLKAVEECKAGTNELLNWINQFLVAIRDVEVWGDVLSEISDESIRISALVEVIGPIVFHALSFPAAIRDKFIFTVGRALRDILGVKRKNGKPYLDHNINLQQLQEILKSVDRIELKLPLEKFIAELGGIDNANFRTSTNNYRNRANHQIAPYIEVGECLVFTSISDDQVEGYSFGVEPAIRLPDLSSPLAEQHKRCHSTFIAYWDVVSRLFDFMRYRD